jgi:hypothetical protein
MQMEEEQLEARPIAIQRFATSLLARISNYWFALASFLIPLAVYLVSINSVVTSDYQVSILTTQYALAKFHSFSLVTPAASSVDLRFFNNRYFSDLPPGFGLISFPLYYAGFLLDGSVFNPFGYQEIFDCVALSLFAAASSLFVFKIARRLGAGRNESLLASLALALASPVYTYTSQPWYHTASLFFSLLAVYFALASNSNSSTRYLYGGLSLGVAMTIEYAAAVLVFPLLFYLIYKSSRKSVILFFATYLVGPLLIVTTNFLTFGNPLIFPEQPSQTSSSVFSLLNHFSLLYAPNHLMIFLFSPFRGLIFFAPALLILGAIAIYQLAEVDKQTREAQFFLFMFLSVLVFYSLWLNNGDWYGGLSYGTRFAILGLPYLAIPLALLLTRRPGLRSTFFILFAIGFIIAAAGALTSSLSVSGNFYLFQPFAFNLPALVAGRIDSWWLAKISHDSTTAELFASVLVLVVLYVVGSLARESRRVMDSHESTVDVIR